MRGSDPLPGLVPPSSPSSLTSPLRVSSSCPTRPSSLSHRTLCETVSFPACGFTVSAEQRMTVMPVAGPEGQTQAQMSLRQHTTEEG